MSKQPYIVLAGCVVLVVGMIWLFGQRPVVKGNGDSMIYHVKGCASYSYVDMNNNWKDQWFFTEQDAKEAGFRKANNCK